MLKNKKTILFIEFHPGGGSPARLSDEIDFIKHFHSEKYECIVITRQNTLLENESKRIGFKIYTSDAVELVGFFRQPVRILKKYITTLILTFWVTLKHNPDFIHCYHYMWSIYANPVAFILNKPIIIQLNDVGPVEPKIARILMKFNPKALFVAVSNHVKSKFVNIYRVNREKIIRIYDGINQDNFPQPNRKTLIEKQNRKEKIIVYMSRVARERDIEKFIETAVILLKKYSSLRFIHHGYHPVFSDQEYFEELKKLIRVLGIEKSFSFKRFRLDPNSVPKTLEKAYLSVIPARQFALPNTAIESMMSGTPVIALNVGGNPEIIRTPSLGTLVAANAAILYAEAVEEYLNNNDKYLSVALKGIEFSRKTFSAREQFKKLIKLYDRLLY